MSLPQNSIITSNSTRRRNRDIDQLKSIDFVGSLPESLLTRDKNTASTDKIEQKIKRRKPSQVSGK